MVTFICRTPLMRNVSGEKYGKTTAQKDALKTILLKTLNREFTLFWREFFWEPTWVGIRLGETHIFVDDSLTPMFFITVYDDEPWVHGRDETFAALFQQALIRFFCEATNAYTAKFTLYSDDKPYITLCPDLLQEYLPFRMYPEEEMPPDGYCWWVI